MRIIRVGGWERQSDVCAPTCDNFQRYGVRAYVTSARRVKATKPIIALLTAGIINPVCVSPVIILSVNGEGDPREYFNSGPGPRLPGEIRAVFSAV